MTARGPRDRGDEARLVELEVTDDPASWADAGFAVEGDLVRLGATDVRLAGADGGARGIRSWTLAGLVPTDEPVDGLPTSFADSATAASSPGPSSSRVQGPDHPNGAIGLDHVVVLTPDLDRTTAAFGELGLSVRRIRDTTANGSPMRQAFLRVGATIIEVVSGDTGTGVPADAAPATWFGLAVDVTDLDRLADRLGDGVGPVKQAVQRGRRIATLRHEALGISVPIAFMDDKGEPTGGGPAGGDPAGVATPDLPHEPPAGLGGAVGS